MTALIIGVTASVVITVALTAVRVALQEAWGRVFDRELTSFLRGGTWIDTADTCEALSLDLIRWSDSMMAGARA